MKTFGTVRCCVIASSATCSCSPSSRSSSSIAVHGCDMSSKSALTCAEYGHHDLLQMTTWSFETVCEIVSSRFVGLAVSSGAPHLVLLGGVTTADQQSEQRPRHMVAARFFHLRDDDAPSWRRSLGAGGRRPSTDVDGEGRPAQAAS
eukprot:scaffold74902_cov78-Phaeocystis_antarctica.AAC.4